MIVREASCRILRMAETYPAVTVAGPRHAGKTTLVKLLFPYHGYVNLEISHVREFARANPIEFLKYHAGDNGIVIDEYLRAPELFAHIRGFAGNDRRPGRFVFVTSCLPQAGYNTMRSFTKHQATQILLPFTIGELRDAEICLDRDEYIHRGFMPRVYNEKKIDPGHIHLNYLTYFANHDVGNVVGPSSRDTFWRFMEVMAGHIGQIVNFGSIARKVGVSLPVLAAWFSVLEANFMITKLPPYPDNFGQKNSKIPKFYFTDIGIAAFLLKIKSSEQVFRDPLVGNLFENLVVIEAYKCRNNARQINTGLYYFRTQNVLEIDLIIDNGRRLIPVEIKSSSKFIPSFADSIKQFQKLTVRAEKGYVVYNGKTQKERPEEPKYINFRSIDEIIGKR